MKKTEFNNMIGNFYHIKVNYGYIKKKRTAVISITILEMGKTFEFRIKLDKEEKYEHAPNTSR